MSRKPTSATPTTAISYACAQAALFVLVYGGCLSYTTSRADVGRMYSDWELRIPLVPAMIVPYLSIYALFFVAFFLCRRDAAELRTLSARLTASQLVAGACYLMFPLECGFHRPAIDGALGALFKLLDATDRPYNLAPSLHVTTAVILGAVFVARTRGAMRVLAFAWFALIGLSTMLTWQHHLVDVVGGAMLGMACLRVGVSRVARELPRIVRAPRPATHSGTFGP
jgi:membrane-associated phospholipid phosphatase